MMKIVKICENGAFGIKECKKAIKEVSVRYFHKSYYELLEEYVERANNDVMFNTQMILACWELINNKD